MGVSKDINVISFEEKVKPLHNGHLFIADTFSIVSQPSQCLKVEVIRGDQTDQRCCV